MAEAQAIPAAATQTVALKPSLAAEIAGATNPEQLKELAKQVNPATDPEAVKALGEVMINAAKVEAELAAQALAATTPEQPIVPETPAIDTAVSLAAAEATPAGATAVAAAATPTPGFVQKLGAQTAGKSMAI